MNLAHELVAGLYRSSSANFRNAINQTLLKHTKRFKRTGRGEYTAK